MQSMFAGVSARQLGDKSGLASQYAIRYCDMMGWGFQLGRLRGNADVRPLLVMRGGDAFPTTHQKDVLGKMPQGKGTNPARGSSPAC